MNKTESPSVKDDPIINHLRNVKLMQAIYGGKKLYVECMPTDECAMKFPNSNQAVKEIELPDFKIYEEEKFGYKWVPAESPSPSLQEAAEAYRKKHSQHLPDTQSESLVEAAFVDGWNAREAQQTGPILTRELHDKIWEAAEEFIKEPLGEHYNGERIMPDKETFFTSLNL